MSDASDGSAGQLLDERVLARLGDEVGDREAALRFAAAYLGLLPTRVDRVCAACTASDSEAAEDAVLSLRVTSAMVGASLLMGLAAEVEMAVTRGDLVTARTAADGLPRVAAATAAAVAALLAEAYAVEHG
ncbi:MAG TPA: Hpt domain-containing protein [Intrasporangium sp.]|uniref:Hpt domain-containing protein n=1 Tax=Intrasporangium sp. TaxID=1925024 RepID=UPI002D773699|nr:Hpt domain-containing protein [Intrasporangium sp.]HET7399319.1 Hpt domain-containing protein [Intrasporangium sp.]